MPTKIRNVELLTLARSDAGTPVLGHVGVGIDANLIQDFEMGLSRVSSAAQFNLALNVEGATTNTAHYGGIAFTQGASADTIMASIKAVNTSVDGYVDLSFNTRTVNEALLIKADGSVGINASGANWTSSQLRIVASSGNSYAARFTKGATNYYFAEGVLYANTTSALHLLNQSGPLRLGANNAEIMRLADGKVGIGTGTDAPATLLEISHSAASHDPVLRLTGAHASGYAAGIEWQSGYGPKTSAQMFSTANSTQGGEFWINVRDQATNALVDRLHIDKDGNIGIGTGSAALTEALEVIGSIKLSDDLEMASGKMIDWGNGDARIIEGETQNYSLTFKTWDGVGCDPRMKILGDGKVGIGTGSSAPSALLQIYKAAPSSGERLFDVSTDDGNIFSVVNYSSSSDSCYLRSEGVMYLGTNADIDAVQINAGKVGIGTGSGAVGAKLHIEESSAGALVTPLKLINPNQSVGSAVAIDFKLSADAITAAVQLKAISPTAGVDGELVISTRKSGVGLVERVRVSTDGNVGIGKAPSELLDVNGNVKATNFLGALTGNVTGNATGNAGTATALETARNIVVGKSSAGAGDIDAITQSFNGSANISFNAELNAHLPSDLRGAASSNIADEAGNDAVKIIGSDINTPRLKINRQGLIVGFEEVATSGGSGSGGISALTLTTNGLLYLNAGLTTQTETTSTSTPTLNLYLKSAGLFTDLSKTSATQYTISSTIGGTTKTLNIGQDLLTSVSLAGQTLSVVVGGVTKTATIPSASFTQFQRISSTQLQATVGATQLTADLSGASVANATNATNAANVAITANATNSTRYLTFVTGSSGNLPLLMDTGITYNPSSNTLATTNFVGALSGNATTSSGLLIGSTTYLPSTSAASTNSLVARNASSQVHIKELVLSDNTTSSSLSMFIGKISGSDILHEFSGGQALALLGINTIFTGNGPYAISITGNAATATTASACSGNAATATTATNATNVNFANTGSNLDYRIIFTEPNDTVGNARIYKDGSKNIYYNPSTNRLTTTTFAGALVGNASSATGLVWSGATRSPSSAATANTIAVRGSGGALTIAGLTCTTVGATTMSAQSLELTNQGTGTNFSLKAHNIVPRGTITSHTPYFSPVNYVANSSIGDFSNPSVGAFDRIDANYLYGTSILQFSDRRLKENISPFELGLDFVRLLEPKSYNKIGSKTPRKYYGAIAQEVAEVMKEIGIEDESMVSIRGHHEKTEEEREQAVKTYDPQQIMWVLFNAVKQLDAEVQDLKKELKK